MPWAAAGAVVGGLISANAAGSAADTQAAAGREANATQLAMFNRGQINSAPWLQAGQGSLAQIQRMLGLGGGYGPMQGASGATPTGFVPTGGGPVGGGPGFAAGVQPRVGIGATPNPMMGANPGAPQIMPGQAPSLPPGVSPGAFAAQQPVSGAPVQTSAPVAGGQMPMSQMSGPFDPTAMLRATPGYQWNVSQGQDAILNRASALGGVNSGATLKALSDYTSNQADNTYNQYMQNLYGLSNTGANTALSQAGIGAGVGQSIGNNIMGIGNVQAAGQVGQANALTGGMSSAYNNWLMSRNPGAANPYTAPDWAQPVPSGMSGGDYGGYGGGGYSPPP